MLTIKIQIEDEEHDAWYESIEQALDDCYLRELLEQKIGVVSIWSGELRLTPDITGWQEFCRQIVNNSTTILRGWKC